MIRVSAETFFQLYKSLPNADHVLAGKLKMIEGDQRTCKAEIYRIPSGERVCIIFKLRNISKYQAEWRPEEEVIIDNSSEDCFSEEWAEPKFVLDK